MTCNILQVLNFAINASKLGPGLSDLFETMQFLVAGRAFLIPSIKYEKNTFTCTILSYRS